MIGSICRGAAEAEVSEVVEEVLGEEDEAEGLVGAEAVVVASRITVHPQR